MELDGLWNHRRVLVCVLLGITSFLLQTLMAVSLNDEGMALLRFKDRIENDPFGALSTWKENSSENDPCSWRGVDCADNYVVSLKLKDLCLAGTLAPELGNIAHLKLIILRNNSLSGVIPEELSSLDELEVLDLGFNKFSGTLPREWGNNIAVLLLDNNGELSEDSSYTRALMRFDHQTKEPVQRRGLQQQGIDEPLPPSQDINPPPPPLLEEPSPPPPPPPPRRRPLPPPPPPPTPTSPSEQETQPPSPTASDAGPTISTSPPSGASSNTLVIAIAGSVGGFVLVVLIVGLLIWRHKKMATVGPWRNGMTERIQKSPVNGDNKIQILTRDLADAAAPNQGLPNLKRTVLEEACEEFSNVIGSSAIGKLYKGTLASGGEIAVLSYGVQYKKDWSIDMQMLFVKKVDKLSKVSHKNFLNLLGYCEEDKPFARMLVFEYAPSGTLFEHLYVRESEHLDWAMRIRITMGIAYCLEHMHALTPSVTHKDLTAYAINLSEDYAAKLSDFGIWNEVALAANPLPILIDTTTSPDPTPEDNVYRFGLVLLEMVTGKAPHSMSTDSLNGWALDYLRGDEPLKGFIDPMLRHFDAEQLEKIGEVIKLCTLPYPNERPRMEEVASRLREITGIAPERAAPRLSLWWPEISLLSSRSQDLE